MSRVESTAVARFPEHTPESATGKASSLLADIVVRNGSASPMVRTMAGSPSVLSGGITDRHIERLQGFGYRDRDILDVVGLVALNVLTGGFNLVAGVS